MNLSKWMKRILCLALVAVVLTLTVWQITASALSTPTQTITAAQDIVDYLAANGTLPDNFLTKEQAQKEGWSSKKYLSDVLPGYSLGGDKFGNREKLLPEATGRTYYECDVDYQGGKRSGKRLVYSNDGLYYYTEDGYKSFTQMTPSQGLAEPQADGPLAAAQLLTDYLYLYGELPDNFLTKKDAEALGWKSTAYYVSDLGGDSAIGGDRFGNYEGQLPKAAGRQYYECDCYYQSGPRNAYRLVYSNDGLYFYSDDHYETFTQLYPSEK